MDETIWKTAQEGLFLLGQYNRTQYTCRYQPVLQMFGVLHLTDVVCRFFPHTIDGPITKDGAQALQFGMEVLIESFPGFPIAGPFQEMLRRTANECSVPLSKKVSDRLAPPRSPKQSYGMDDFIDACTRTSYTQPADEIHNRYLPSFSSDWSTCGRVYGFHEPPAGRQLRGQPAERKSPQTLMQISNLLNTN